MSGDTPSPGPALRQENDPALHLAAAWCMRQHPGLQAKATVSTALWPELTEVQLRDFSHSPRHLFNRAFGRLVDALYAEGFRCDTFMTAARNGLRPGGPGDDKALLHAPLYARLTAEDFDLDDPANKQLMRSAQAVVLLSAYLEQGHPNPDQRHLCAQALNRHTTEVARAFPRTLSLHEPKPFAGIDATCTRMADELGNLWAAMEGITTPWRNQPRYRLQQGGPRAVSADKGLMLSDAFSALKAQGYACDEPALNLRIKRSLCDMDEPQRDTLRRIVQELALIHRHAGDDQKITPLHHQQLPQVATVRASQFAQLLGIEHPQPHQAAEALRKAEETLKTTFGPKVAAVG